MTDDKFKTALFSYKDAIETICNQEAVLASIAGSGDKDTQYFFEVKLPNNGDKVSEHEKTLTKNKINDLVEASSPESVGMFSIVWK